ncbi:MAG TPA: sigma-54 dependent transcriptional regulator [Methylomirabilota bacterium]|jgi:DNA-binding NtrC family response regulator|nr:sigma-54 dependent transcriptional regulator [Methylomirabilota bacterium]
MKRRLLLVEDDEVFLRPLHRTLELKGYEVLPVQSGEEALDRLKSEDVDVVLTDRRLPGMDGVELVRQVKAEHPDLALVVMTAYGTIESAVEAMRVGAEDYLVKPFEAAELLVVIRRAIEFQELKAANRRTLRHNQERFTFSNILARSSGMQSIFDLVRSVVDLDTTVLIYGETGVGKELLARSIHFSGARRDRPFVAVNCAAIPGELFESELFGSRKGAFTGATEHRRGQFQMANGGTLLLDEIGEMPLPLQSKLLRAIEEKKVTSVGADRPVDIDVRFIATTNKDLQEEVDRGTFRRDLFYRLSVMPIRVPPLRERPEDIPLLAEHFLDQANRRSKKNVRAIVPASLQALVRYPWPGNVRELENVIERAVIVATGDTLTDIERFLAAGGAQAAVDLSLPFRDAKARVVEEFERAYVAGLLEAHGGKLTVAAKHADMDPKNFSEKMARYGLRRSAGNDGDTGARSGGGPA